MRDPRLWVFGSCRHLQRNTKLPSVCPLRSARVEGHRRHKRALANIGGMVKRKPRNKSLETGVALYQHRHYAYRSQIHQRSCFPLFRYAFPNTVLTQQLPLLPFNLVFVCLCFATIQSGKDSRKGRERPATRIHTIPSATSGIAAVRRLLVNQQKRLLFKWLCSYLQINGKLTDCLTFANFF